MVKRRILTQEMVVETAVSLVNKAGSAEAISLKQLANALNIKVPSLYNHVKGMAGLLDAMRLHGQALMLIKLREATFGKVGKEAIMAMAQAYRQFAQENPGVYPLTQQAPRPDDSESLQNAAELLQMVSLLFASYGLQQGDDMIHAIRGLRSLMHGFAHLEMAGGFGLPQDVDESFERLVETYLLGLSKVQQVI